VFIQATLHRVIRVLNSLRHFQRIRFQQRRVIVNPPIVLLIRVPQISPPAVRLLGELLLGERLALASSVTAGKISRDGRKVCSLSDNRHQLLRARPAVEVLHGEIAFAGSVFQAWAIQNGNGAPDILDQRIALQNSRRQAHTRASSA
jgi:hypothetical protein